MSCLVFGNLFLRRLLFVISLLMYLFVRGACYAFTCHFFRGEYFSSVFLRVLLKDSKLNKLCIFTELLIKIINKNLLLKFL